MARGASRAQSELPDVSQYGEGGAKRRDGVYASNSYKAYAVDFIDRAIKAGFVDTYDVQDGVALNDAANAVYEAIDDKLYNLEAHSERVARTERLLASKDPIDWSLVRNALPLTAEEMAEADRKKESFGSFAKTQAIYEFDDAFAEDTRGNFTGDDAKDKPYFARKLLEGRLAAAKELLNDMRDEVETKALATYREWASNRRAKD